MSIISELNTARRAENDKDKRQKLDATADLIVRAISDLYYNPSTENMKFLNGQWARAVRMLAPKEEEAGDKVPA